MRARRDGRIGRVLLSALLLLAASGCSRPKQRFKPAILVTRGDVVAYVRTALEHEDADVRRRTIEQLARTRHAGLPGVIDALALAARTDESDCVRRAAMRALRRRGGRKALETSLALLDPAADEARLRPIGDELRFEAVKTLKRFAESGGGDEESQGVIRDRAIRLLATDPSRDVRLCAAQVLGRYPAVESAAALIAALRQDDFGVVHASERSLTRLTGRANGFDAARWRRWFDSTDDPFAARGARDVRGDSKQKKRWWFWRHAS